MQGLQNLGSTCAVNSLIQIICRTQYLRDILLNTTSTSSLTSELQEIIAMMHNQNHSVSPKKFINYLYDKYQGIFTRGEQIDIGELWMFVNDTISNDLGIVDNNKDKPPLLPVANVDIYDNTSIATNAALVHNCTLTISQHNNYKMCPWIDAGQGIMLQIVCCNECSNVLYNFEPFASIPLDIPPDKANPPTVTTMFRNYLKGETDCNEWKCEKCNKCTTYTRSMKIWKMPKVLVFFINRFANMHQKNVTPININKTFTVKKGSVMSDMNNDYKYKCTALGLHFGSLSGGHYCAVSNSDDKHILYDDLNINIIENPEQIDNLYKKSQEGYMLVYSLD